MGGSNLPLPEMQNIQDVKWVAITKSNLHLGGEVG